MGATQNVWPWLCTLSGGWILASPEGPSPRATKLSALRDGPSLELNQAPIPGTALRQCGDSLGPIAWGQSGDSLASLGIAWGQSWASLGPVLGQSWASLGPVLGQSRSWRQPPRDDLGTTRTPQAYPRPTGKA